jgi:GT2 family glycosyltransferase
MTIVQQKASPIIDLASDCVPMRILEVELAEALPALAAFDANKGRGYQRARCLVRLHTHPLGLVEFPIEKDEVSPDEYLPAIWQVLHEQINEHLRQDELPPVSALTAQGLASRSMPACLEAREAFFLQVPFVSVIVATRDRPEALAACLQSLLALRYPHYEIIVVDNASRTPATAELVHQLAQKAPHLRYVREARPGLAWAHNQGMLAARGEILAFTDDDVVVDAYWLINLVKGFRVADKVACVTSLILPLELETPAQFLFEAYGGFTRGFVRRIFDLKEHHPGLPLHPYIAGRFGTGAGMAFTAAFLKSIGGFDPALGTGTRTGGSDDLDAFFQVVMRGYQVVYEPTSLLYHLHRREYVQLQKQIYYYGVGFTAFLTKIALDSPRLLFDFIGKLPYAFFYLFRLRLSKRKGKPIRYPKELKLTEWKGRLYGPFAYMQSRWEVRKFSRKSFLDEIFVAIPMKRKKLGS